MAKRSLLLVDGDAKSLRVLEVSLKKAGFNVTTASTGIDALEKVENSQPDLVISDTEMPEMDGYAFCREFKKRPEWAEIPFVFLTGQTAIENKIKGLELGVDDYLTKPIYIKEILTRVRILLQKRDRANFEQKKDNNTRFAGRLNDMGVVDLIQTIEVSRKTGVIHFRADEKRQATLFFKEGRVIDAEAGHLQGEDAVYRLLTWSDGEFEALFRPVRRKPVIQMSPQALLMEGMRRLDEWGRLQEQLPPLTQKFEVVYDELWDRLADLPDDLNQILRLFDSRRTLAEVIDGANIGDLEAVEIISKLYFEGIIVEAGAAMGGTSGSFPIDELLNQRKTKRKTPAPPTDPPVDAEESFAGLDDDDAPDEADTPDESDDETLGEDAFAGKAGGDVEAELAAAEAANTESTYSGIGEAAPDLGVMEPTSGDDEIQAEIEGTAPLTPVPPAGDLLAQAIDSVKPAMPEPKRISAKEMAESEPPPRAEDPRRTTTRGIAVAQLKLQKRAPEEVMASNLRKRGSEPKGAAASKPSPQPFATPPLSDDASELDESISDVSPVAEDSDAFLDPNVDPEDFVPELSEESVPIEAQLDVVEKVRATTDDRRDPDEKKGELLLIEKDDGEPTLAAVPVEDSSKRDTSIAQSAEEFDSDEQSISLDADDPGEDDEAPNRPFVEDVHVSGVISSEGAVNAAVSGALASKAAAEEVEIDEAEPIRAAPSISAHDDFDEDDEGRKTPLGAWIGGGMAAAGLVIFALSGRGGSATTKPGEAALSTQAPPRVGTPVDQAALAGQGDASVTPDQRPPDTSLADVAAAAKGQDAASAQADTGSSQQAESETPAPDKVGSGEGKASGQTDTQDQDEPTKASEEDPNQGKENKPGRQESSEELDDDAKARALVAKARRARRQGERIEAMHLLDESIELRTSSSALLLKAEILLDLGDSGAALRVAEDLTRVASRRSQGWRIKGLAEYEQKKYAEARRSFERYLELSPNAKDAADVRLLLDSL